MVIHETPSMIKKQVKKLPQPKKGPKKEKPRQGNPAIGGLFRCNAGKAEGRKRQLAAIVALRAPYAQADSGAKRKNMTSVWNPKGD